MYLLIGHFFFVCSHFFFIHSMYIENNSYSQKYSHFINHFNLCHHYLHHHHHPHHNHFQYTIFPNSFPSTYLLIKRPHGVAVDKYSHKYSKKLYLPVQQRMFNRSNTFIVNNSAFTKLKGKHLRVKEKTKILV